MTRATISTDLGDIDVDLFTEAAPKAAQNFIDLARKGFYDDVIFHRVIPGFVIQGGDGQYAWSGDLQASYAGQGGPGYQFNDEPVVGDYTRGTVAMTSVTVADAAPPSASPAATSTAPAATSTAPAASP